MSAVNLVQTGSAVVCEELNTKTKKGEDGIFAELVMAILTGNAVQTQPQELNGVIPQDSSGQTGTVIPVSAGKGGSEVESDPILESYQVKPETMPKQGILTDEDLLRPKAIPEINFQGSSPGTEPQVMKSQVIEPQTIELQVIEPQAMGTQVMETQGIETHAQEARGNEVLDKAGLTETSAAVLPDLATTKDAENPQDSLVLNLLKAPAAGTKELFHAPQAKNEFYLLLHKVFQEVVLSSSDKGRTFSVKLVPEHLGGITIQVSLEEGKLNTHIRVENTGVIDLFNSQIGELRDTMSNLGMEVGLMQVGLGHSSQRQSSGKKAEGLQLQDPDQAELPLAEYAFSTGSGQVLDILA